MIQNRKRKDDRPHSFVARVAYPWKNAAVVETANLAGTWYDAAFQMQATADLAPFVQNPSYHIILSFSETEHPSDREIFDAGHRVVKEFGANEHQYMMAIHKNRINIHLHIVCNRVHPISGRVLPTGHDFARLELACRKIEHSNGWPQDRGRFDCTIVDDEAMLVPKPDAHWQQRTRDRTLGHRPDGRAVRRHEQRNGLPPLRNFLPPETLDRLRSAIDDSESWKHVHEALAAASLRYEKLGTGARISRPGGIFFMPAGQIGTSCTLKSLESRLGRFEAVKVVSVRAGHKQIAEPDLMPEARGPSPIEVVVLAVKGMIKDIELWRRSRNEARANLRAVQHEEKRQVRDYLKGNRSLAAQALRKVMGALHREQVAELRLQHPPPHPMPLDATSQIIRLAPDELHRRRYRHVHRFKALLQSQLPRDLAHDHTACRQAWCLAQATDIALIKNEEVKSVLRNTNSIRVSGPGTLLLARRNAAGSIVGFHICHEDNLAAKAVRPKGSGEGLCLIGPRAASTCVIVPDVVTGLVEAAAGDEANELIIIAPRLMTRREQHQLHDLRQGRAKTDEVQSVLAIVRGRTEKLGHSAPKDANSLDDSDGTVEEPGLEDLYIDRGHEPF